MSKEQILGTLLEVDVNDSEDKLYELGLEIGKLYTNHGFPIDMALERLEARKTQKVSILGGALHWLVIHKRNSNATEGAIDRQRATNLEIMERFLSTGETGVY